MPTIEPIDEYEIDPNINNIYMLRNIISFLASSNTMSTNDAYHCIDNIISNEFISDSDGFMKNEVCTSKEKLQVRLCKLALQNYFQFKIVTSGKNILIVTCIDNNCHWGIRATKITDSSYF